MTVDWWEFFKTVASFVGAGTGGLALYLNRRDAGRARKASEPRATVLLNPNAEADGRFVIKLTFDNVRQSIVLNSAEIVRPRAAVITARTRSDRGAQDRDESSTGRQIGVKWAVNPPHDGKSAAGFAHLSLRLPPDTKPSSVVLKLRGHNLAGMQEPVVIDASGRT